MRRWLLRIGAVVGVLLLLAIVSAWGAMRASLPKLDGMLSLPGLSAPVTVKRDALGVVTIDAANERDALRALGYVHGQERFFEMDLLRRSAAGELAELFGPAAINVDKAHRVHRMRARVQQRFDEITGDRKADVLAYTEGVNAGLAALPVRPWTYLLLRQQPKPWRPEDTPLVAYAMYFDLQGGSNERELAMWRMRPHLPPALYALLARGGSAWDAPLTGGADGDAVLPGADAVNLRELPVPALATASKLREPFPVGSNNFAVSGAATRDGRAILANDMHLGLRAPNIWFRARLRYPDARAESGRVDVAGFTLPGMPAVVVGSNTQVAWGFTNSYIDSADWGRYAKCGADRYRIGAACVAPVHHRESIAVAGGAPVAFDVEETPWGPVMAHDDAGDALALRWSAHLPGSLRMAFLDMAYARDLDDALARADRMAIPAQNLMLADSRDIAWRILGPIPARQPGCATDVADANACMFNLRIDASPVVKRPISGRLWTANNRVVGGADRVHLGDGGYLHGARAKQIRDDLFARPNFDEQALLAIQLDDRALFLARWWRLLQDTSKAPQAPALQALASAAQHWDGRASTDSVSYRIVRAWRRAIQERLADGLTAPAQAQMGKAFDMPGLPQFESVMWPLVTQRPMHLLPRRYASWEALFEDAAQDVQTDLQSQGPLDARTWGEQNTARICHPLVRALPFAKYALCMPFDPLPGDGSMPRVQAPDDGASERMVVSPGHEAEGITHMPGGQSGNPLSPFWGAGHEDWVHGRATPFLPGDATHTMTLQPASTR
ncbi:penicillin acylase family protein [Lysobacter sp. KIS68-7]|uniref:penicillin acylase family protein n=1 Tax=Lysobacter sp. KIS68-7 TaxID=2904252 RepID=UPI001E5FD938|nr:penicillin acylase family protein [Lysobacter sp. KIS68-7]UHQ19412.1 penicillin acylase family protein [Lysobacter sp. KIS68-7]